MIDRLFKYQASSDYDSYSVQYTWHKKRRVLRRLFATAVAATPAARPTVTDIGCGDGFDLFALRRTDGGARCASFLGLDINLVDVEYCRARAAHEGCDNVRFEVRDAVAEPLRPGELGDIAICSEVVEHLADPDSFIRNLAGAMPPGGHLILTTPNGRSWSARLRRLLGREATPAPAHPGPSLGHVSVRDRKEWRRVCAAAGLLLVTERRGSLIYGSPRLDRNRPLAGASIVADAVLDFLRLNDTSWETLQLYRKRAGSFAP